MKKHFLLFFSFLLFIACSLPAQDWVSMMRDPKVNVHDVQKAFYKWNSLRQQKLGDKDKQPNNESEEEEGNYEQFRTWEWFWYARTYPSGVRPDMERVSSEYQDYLQSKDSHRSARSHNVQAVSNWSYAGSVNVPNGGEAGRVNRIRFYPGNNNIIYACTPSGGLWKSIDGGAHWSTNTDQLLDLAISDIAINPVNPSIMYIGTGDNDGLSSGFTPSTIGVLKSTDGGNTWKATSLYYTIQTSSGMTVNELLIDPDNSNEVFAATSFGLYCSKDAGVTWNYVLLGDIKNIEFEPYHASTMYACTSTDGFYRSTDGGGSFTKISNGVPGPAAGRLAIAVTPADSNYVYLLADEATGYGFYGLYLSTDRGQTFNLQSNSPNLLGWAYDGSDNTGQGWYTLSLAASPTDANSIIVGGVNVWASGDGGVSWTLNADWTGTGAYYIHADIHQLCYPPGSSGSTYFASCDGGIFKTTDGGNTWPDLSSGLEISQQYAIGLSASNSNMWLTGWQDNGTNLAGAPWKEVLGGDGMVCFIDYSNNSNMFGSFYNGNLRGSNNGGASWYYAASGITETGPWVTRWLQDPQTPNVLYAGFDNIWKSTDRGASWSQLSSFVNLEPITTIAVAPSNNNYIYAACFNYVYVSSNAGATWKDISAGLSLGATGIAIDPNNPLRVWITYSGFSATDKVYYSANAGGSWNNVSAGLPNLPVNCIVYQKGSPDGIYVGTDRGVYYHDTIIKAWVDFSNSLPNVIVQDLKIYAPGNLLRAATYGRGTWQTPLYTSPVAAPVVGFTVFPSKICAGNTVQFTDTSSNQPSGWNWVFKKGNPSSSTMQNPMVTYDTAGSFYVKLTVLNANGADSITDSNYITVYPLPPALTITQAGGEDSLICTPSNLNYYEWYLQSNPIASSNNYFYTPVWRKGVYTVNATDGNGCQTSGRFVVLNVPAGINEITSGNYIDVFPNPTSGILQVQFDVPAEGQYNLTINNVLGQSVYSNNINVSGRSTQSIDLSGYSKGVYILSIKGRDFKLQKKIVVY